MRRVFFLLALLIIRPVHTLPQSTSQETTNRAPFGIELPEMEPEILMAEAYFNISIPAGRSITRIKLWVLEPYADRVGYNISALLNDQALSSVSKTGSGLKGKYLDINLLQNPNIKLKPGKNTLEVMARETRSGMTYRCSFVLMLGQTKAATNRPTLAEGCATEISISSHLAPVDPHVLQSDRTAPQVTLTSPAAALNAATTVQSVRVTGSAGDAAGPVRTVTINGQLIAETPLPKEKRFSLPSLKKGSKKNAEPPPAPPLNFDTTFAVLPDVRDLLIEATDAGGNRTTVRVPILQPGCADAVIAQRNAALATAKDTGFSGRRYAVVVGISDYQFEEAGLSDLQFAHRDALAFAEWLRKPEGGGFGQKDIVCLTNAEATKPALNRALTGFLDNAGPNDLIFLFLAGHGAPDPLDDKGTLYFLLHDSKISALEKTALAMNDLGEFVDKKSKGTRLIAFFDTCHSAGIKNQPSGVMSTAKTAAQGDRAVSVKNKPPKTPAPSTPAAPPKTTPQPAATSGFDFYNAGLFKQKGWTIITSSGMTQLSQESTRWGGGHGVFTWALLEGAQGKADANGDCKITAGELANYVTATVSRETGKEQTPQSLPGSNRDLEVAAVQNAPSCQGKPRK